MGTRGNAILIVEKLPERMGTTFSLLKCVTFKEHIANHFPAKNVTILQDFASTISKFFRG